MIWTCNFTWLLHNYHLTHKGILNSLIWSPSLISSIILPLISHFIILPIRHFCFNIHSKKFTFLSFTHFNNFFCLSFPTLSHFFITFVHLIFCICLIQFWYFLLNIYFTCLLSRNHHPLVSFFFNLILLFVESLFGYFLDFSEINYMLKISYLEESDI